MDILLKPKNWGKELKFQFGLEQCEAFLDEVEILSKKELIAIKIRLLTKILADIHWIILRFTKIL